MHVVNVAWKREEITNRDGLFSWRSKKGSVIAPNMINTAANIFHVFRLSLNQHALKAFAHAGHAGCAAAGKGIKHKPARRRHKLDKVGHEIDRLHGRVL